MRRLNQTCVIERGQSLVKEGMLWGWKEVVEKRKDDIYKLNISLDVIEALKQGKPFEEAYKIIEQTCVCDESEEFILLAVKTFTEYGIQFCNWVENKKLSNEEELAQIEQ